MKIYTKTGDDGTTGLFGGGRVPKDHPRVDAYGTVDELNCHLGAIRSAKLDSHLDALLARAQADLFALGADLASPDRWKAASIVRLLEAKDALWLEEAIDRLSADLSPLRTFILPGGAPAGAAVHVARAVCRRAERAVVSLSHSEPVGPGAIVYLNRLSDFLFTLARSLNRAAGVVEEPWTP